MSSSPPKRVLVTGARGQLAGAIIDAYKGSAEVLAYSRQDLDITNADAVMARIRGLACPMFYTSETESLHHG